MSYFTILLVIISFGFIQNIKASCRDKSLYCFDLRENRIGEINVGQCWEWSRLSCQPCSANTNNKKITYEKYLITCRFFYPESVKVLDTKSVWANRIKDVINDRAIGRK